MIGALLGMQAGEGLRQLELWLKNQELDKKELERLKRNAAVCQWKRDDMRGLITLAPYLAGTPQGTSHGLASSAGAPATAARQEYAQASAQPLLHSCRPLATFCDVAHTLPQG